MRLFVGIALDEAATAALRSVLERFAGSGGEVRWAAEATWHVTLEFLGEASEEQAACVVERLRAVEADRVPVRIDALGFFERAGIFHAEVALTPELLALEQTVTAATRGCGFAREARAYHPHITLAKAKGRNPRAMEPLRRAVERAKFALTSEFVAAEFLLYESFPGPEGSRYEVRERFRLGPSQDQST
jgi:RNA 2',3'-cyclic 3'-phosphodiesterase